MSIYKYDNVKYDINEKNDYLQYFKSAKTIPSKSTETFRAAKQLGFCDKGLYKISILSGIKHNVDDYKYTPLIVMLVKETYQDSDGDKHIIYKLINLGGYVAEKNQSVEVKHLSKMLCAQLIDIEGMIINISNFSITVQGLSLYKAMSYANSYMEGDLSGLTNEQVITDAEDIGDGLWHEVWKSWKHSINKFGELEYWNTSSKWQCEFKKAISNAWGYEYIKRPWTAFDDKGNFLGSNDSEYIQLPNYSEYIIFNFLCDTELWDSQHSEGNILIVYLNNVGRYYAGTAQKYNYKFIDSIQADYIDAYNNYEIFSLSEDKNEITEYSKYNNAEGAGIVTLQLVVEVDNGDDFTVNYYCSTKPFTSIGLSSLKESVPIIIDGHIMWFVDQFTYGSTLYGEHVPYTKIIDITRTTEYQYNNMKQKSLKERVEYFFTDTIKAITEKGEALEDKYPDGNKEG